METINSIKNLDKSLDKKISDINNIENSVDNIIENEIFTLEKKLIKLYLEHKVKNKMAILSLKGLISFINGINSAKDYGYKIKKLQNLIDEYFKL